MKWLGSHSEVQHNAEPLETRTEVKREPVSLWDTKLCLPEADIRYAVRMEGAEFGRMQDNEKLPVNERIIVDGVSYYTDDNGKVFRIDDNLAINAAFEVNHYSYHTDELGRVITAEGMLQEKDHDGRYSMLDRDKIPIDTTVDDRGHLIGDQFNGSGRLENLVPMDKELNEHGDYSKMETKLADAVKDGAEVYLKVESIYEGDSSRPVSFHVTYEIDGDKTIEVYNNGGKGYAA